MGPGATRRATSSPPEPAAARHDTEGPAAAGPEPVAAAPAEADAPQRLEASGGPVGGAPPAAGRTLVALGAAAVLLVATAVLLGVGWRSARSSPALANEAFVDTAATAELVGQVSEAIRTVYSYDFTRLADDEAKAKAVVTGGFAEEFAKVFEPVKQLAPGQQAVLTTTVPATGVIRLQGDRAQLLMMVDQRGVRGPEKQPTGATARLVVDAQRVDGRWKIAEVVPQ